jgi:hypothetical protein
MQTTAIRTVAKSLPQNKVILLTCLISNSYIPYTDYFTYWNKLFHLLEQIISLAGTSCFYLTKPTFPLHKPYALYSEMKEYLASDCYFGAFRYR